MVLHGSGEQRLGHSMGGLPKDQEISRQLLLGEMGLR